ncbi:MAG: DUF4212 domain-containing protein, partial [Rhodoferax sp.]|nr:DUF4212 domain-containing protein [Rhodoferax sp.]
MRASRFGGFHIGLLLAWFLASFGLVFFAEDLQFTVAGWPLGYWLAAQGSVLAFIAIVVIFAWVANRRVPEEAAYSAQLAAYRRRLHGRFAMYLVVLMLFMAALVVAEDLGLRKTWMGAIFVFATIALYAGIGIYSRTSDADEYFVAGRRIPAVYNGMATAADWMSAASFISLAGGLYLQGFSGNGLQPGGLVYIIGWTGGFCLVALMVAPYLRRLGLYTVPDFFGVRYGGRWPRRIAALAAVVCSFMYVVAQIYGVGLITSRLTGVQFEIGILLGLGGVLLCSFLGGMRAVTWTQVAQYVILILAFLIPVSWLAFKQLGNPMAPFVYGQQLQKITALESRLAASPAEQQVTDVYARRARHYEAKLRDVEGSLERDRQALLDNLRQLQERRAEDAAITEVRRELAALPRDTVAARDVWTRAWVDSRDRARTLAGMPPHVQPFPPMVDASGTLLQTPEASRLNFLALMFCLMVGTAGMPHLLTRFLTTSSVSETRRSVAWSLFFIALLY